MRTHLKPNKHSKPIHRKDVYIVEDVHDHEDTDINTSNIDDDSNYHSTDYLLEVLRDMFPQVPRDELEQVWLRHRPDLDSAVCQLIAETQEFDHQILRSAEAMSDDFDFDHWPGLHSEDANFMDDWSSIDDRWTSPPSELSYRDKISTDYSDAVFGDENSQASFTTWYSSSTSA
jgi:hypothetical protein